MCSWVSTFRLPEIANENVANQRKRNFYKRWRHEIRHRGPTVKIAPGPPIFLSGSERKGIDFDLLILQILNQLPSLHEAAANLRNQA